MRAHIRVRALPVAFLIAALVVAAVSGCTPNKPRDADAVSVSTSAHPGEELTIKVGRYGIACRRTPGQSYTSYSAADAGKAGVPALSTSETTLLRRIQHYERSNTLRFLVLPHKEPWLHSLVGNFVVFDPEWGPCSNHLYWILNQRLPGNLWYAPTNLTEGPFPMMGVVTPGPWLRSASEWCAWTRSDAKLVYRNINLLWKIAPKEEQPMIRAQRYAEDRAVREACGSKGR